MATQVAAPPPPPPPGPDLRDVYHADMDAHVQAFVGQQDPVQTTQEDPLNMDLIGAPCADEKAAMDLLMGTPLVSESRPAAAPAAPAETPTPQSQPQVDLLDVDMFSPSTGNLLDASSANLLDVECHSAQVTPAIATSCTTGSLLDVLADPMPVSAVAPVVAPAQTQDPGGLLLDTSAPLASPEGQAMESLLMGTAITSRKGEVLAGRASGNARDDVFGLPVAVATPAPGGMPGAPTAVLQPVPAHTQPNGSGGVINLSGSAVAPNIAATATYAPYSAQAASAAVPAAAVMTVSDVERENVTAPKQNDAGIRTEGFGSSDLFVDPNAPATVAGRVQADAAAAITWVAQKLPENINEHLPDNLRAGQTNVEAPQLSESEMERAHKAEAVNRACEGKWVPAYMRHQMAQNGHTSVPGSSAPNAHEHDANAPPPTVGGAFVEMGTEVGDHAQNVFAYVVTFLSSLAMQCQVCTVNTATSAHEQSLDGWCNDAPADDPLLAPLVDEASAGFGPMRSQLSRSMQRLSFSQIVQLAKTKLVTPNAPPELVKLVKSRELSRRRVSPDESIEDLAFTTEVSSDAVARELSQHVSNVEGGFSSPLVCRERWQINHRQQHCTVQVSSEPAGGPVTIVLRMYITRADSSAGAGPTDPAALAASAPPVFPEAPGAGCVVDSRLFAYAREMGTPLPQGLVEQLVEAHHQNSERLRDLILAFAEGSAPADGLASTRVGASNSRTGGVSGPLPVVQVWPLPADRPRSWGDGPPNAMRSSERPGSFSTHNPPSAFPMAQSQFQTGPGGPKASFELPSGTDPFNKLQAQLADGI